MCIFYIPYETDTYSRISVFTENFMTQVETDLKKLCDFSFYCDILRYVAFCLSIYLSTYQPIYLSTYLQMLRNTFYILCSFSSVQSLSSVSNSMRPHGLQHARILCPSPTPWVYSNSCPLSQWCHSAISSSVVPFSSCLQVFPAPRSFQKSWFFASGGQSISFSISPSSEYWGLISFRTDWLDLLTVQGTLKNFLQHHSSKASILWCSTLFIVQLSHPYMTTGKTIALTRCNFVGKVMSLGFDMLSRLVITFLPSSKHLLISSLQSPSAVILEPPKIKLASFHCFPIYLPWSDGTRCHDLSFLNVDL